MLEGMTLGQILGAARRSAPAFEGWLRACDPDFAQSLTEAAALHGESVTQFVRIAVVEFTEFAGDEDWTTLMSNLRETQDPALECLARMAMRRLAALEESSAPCAA